MTLTNTFNQTDTYISGKLYPKLDAFMISQRPESKGVLIYWGSSCQFKTMKAYKSWLLNQEKWSHLTFNIRRAEI
jgi:hypothetical protein